MKYLILLLLSFSVVADEKHHGKEITNYSVINQYSADGIALSMGMGAIQFDLNTNKPQIGVGFGSYKSQYGQNTVGGAIGFGKRICFSSGNCGLINMSGGISEGGGVGFSAGATWAFK